jgi:DNA modification methylase
MNFKIYNMDVLEGLKQLPNDSVDCVVTSPPYWGLRDYKNDGQIGLEETPQLYIDKIVAIGNEVKRILKPSGSYWLNIGDSYYSKSGSGQGSNFLETHQKYDGGDGKLKAKHQQVRGKFNDGAWLQPKQRLLIPHRIAIGLQESGWILRNDIIWHKPSCMPSSVQDRLSNTYEYFFHFVKQPKYFYDLDALRVPYKENSIERSKKPVNTYNWHNLSKVELCEGQSKTDVAGKKIAELNPLGKNPGDVWDITNNGFELGHFAVFPKELIRPCIKATCPKEGDLNVLVQYVQYSVVAEQIATKQVMAIQKYCAFENDLNSYVHIKECIIPIGELK